MYKMLFKALLSVKTEEKLKMIMTHEIATESEIWNQIKQSWCHSRRKKLFYHMQCQSHWKNLRYHMQLKLHSFFFPHKVLKFCHIGFSEHSI